MSRRLAARPWRAGARWPLIGQAAPSSGLADQRGEIPAVGPLIVSKDVHPSIISIDLEPALHRSEPSVDHAVHGKPALAEPEGERLLVTAVPGVALHTNGHRATIPTKWCAMAIASTSGSKPRYGWSWPLSLAL